MAGTVVLQVRRRLVEAWRSDGRLNGIEIHYSHPGADLVGEKAIIFGPAVIPEATPVGHRATRIRREETVEQPVLITCWLDGLDQEEADEVSVGILTVVEGLLAEDVQVDGAAGEDQQVISLTLKSWRQLAGTTDRGHASEIEFVLGYNARSL